MVGPVTLAGERMIPVTESFEQLLGGGLQRGTTMRIEGMVGTTSLGLSLCARATSSGLWMGCLNMRSVGWAAAESMGVDLCRVVSVDVPAADVADAVAAMVDVFDLVVCDGLDGLSRSQSQRLSARVRERGCVLMVLEGITSAGRPLVDQRYVSRRSAVAHGSSDMVMEVEGVTWSGLGDGRGRLGSRSVDVVARGRRGLERPRSVRIDPAMPRSA